MSISQTHGYMVNFQLVCAITFATNVHTPTIFVIKSRKVAFECLRADIGVTERANSHRNNDYAKRGGTSTHQETKENK